MITAALAAGGRRADSSGFTAVTVHDQSGSKGYTSETWLTGHRGSLSRSENTRLADADRVNAHPQMQDGELL